MGHLSALSMSWPSCVQDLLNRNIIDHGINFSFIAAFTPHFGGLWELTVESTKHLRRILGLTNLTFEEMATCLIQVEAILNSRPLTPLSNDPSDLAPLTPAHFLIGRSLIMLPHPQVQNASVNIHLIEYLKQHFWARFTHEYVLWLQERTKWCRSSSELKEGTMVVIKDNNLPPLMWLLGRIAHSPRQRWRRESRRHPHKKGSHPAHFQHYLPAAGHNC